MIERPVLRARTQRGPSLAAAPASAVALAVVVLLAVVGCAASSTGTTPPASTGTTGSAGPTGPAGSSTTSAGGSQVGSGSGTTSATSSAGVAVAAASAGCSTPGPATAAGQHVDVPLTSAGRDRTYKQYVPASAPTTPNALIIDLHGYQEGAGVHTIMSNLGALADKEGFLLVTPQGTGKIPFWNAVPEPGGPDDVQFLTDVLDDVSAKRCVDPSRVYMSGLSNGAFMTSLMACRLADRIAAVAPVAGLRWPESCSPSRPIPIVAFHGTADRFVSFDGTPGAAAAELPFDEESKQALGALTFSPIPDTLARWATAEGCATAAKETKVSASVTLVSYDGCRGGSTVELYRIDGGGHAWPGSEFSRTIERVVGPTTFEIDANQLMWAFFQQHPLPR